MSENTVTFYIELVDESLREIYQEMEKTPTRDSALTIPLPNNFDLTYHSEAPEGVPGWIYSALGNSFSFILKGLQYYGFFQLNRDNYSRKIPLGIKAMAVDGYGRQIPYFLLPRSSTGLRYPIRMSNSIGLIDYEYRGEIGAIVDILYETDSLSPENLKSGHRLFQLMPITFCRNIEVKLVDKLPESDRGEGGFGSTGK